MRVSVRDGSRDLSVMRGRRLVGQDDSGGLGVSHTGSVIHRAVCRSGRVGLDSWGSRVRAVCGSNGRILDSSAGRVRGRVSRGVADLLNGRRNLQLHLRLGVAVTVITVGHGIGSGQAQEDNGDTLEKRLDMAYDDNPILLMICTLVFTGTRS